MALTPNYRPLKPLGIALFLSLSSPAQALPPLAQDQHINNSLMSAAIAESVRQNCPSISARILMALSKVKELERYALKLGYSKAEIKAFIASKPDRERLKRAASAYMVENGVVAGNKETYCSLGRAEIKRRSLVGQLIWSWK